MTNTLPSPIPAFEGTADAAAFIARVQAFLHDELAPLAAQQGITHEQGADKPLLQQVWQLSHARGFYGMTLPQAMGGAGFDVVDHVLIKEAIYASGSPFAPHVLGELSGPPRLGALVKTATPEQMQRFILPVARAEKAICFAITEPEAGSDAAALQTRADTDGDGFVLNGVKRFISGSPFCDMAVVIAATDLAKRETTAFIVERDRPGFRIETGYKTMAGQSGTGNIHLENCRIPAVNRIGERGKGLALALGRITVNRLLHTPAMLGLARLAFEDARAHALRRQQFGQPIASFQAIQHMLADMATELAAARALMLSVARRIDAGADARAEASMAKLFCSETAFRIDRRAGAGQLSGQGDPLARALCTRHLAGQHGAHRRRGHGRGAQAEHRDREPDGRRRQPGRPGCGPRRARRLHLGVLGFADGDEHAHLSQAGL